MVDMMALPEATKIQVLGRKEEMSQIPKADFLTMVARKNIEVGEKMEEAGVRRTSLVLRNLSAKKCGRQLEVSRKEV